MSDDDFIALPKKFPANIYDWYLKYQSSPEYAQDLADNELREAGYSSEQYKCFIYVVHCPPDFYKIGRAKDVKVRLGALQTYNPYPLSLVHIIPCDDAESAENFLHMRFSSKHVRGEWYKLQFVDVELIKSLVVWKDGAFVVKSKAITSRRGR